MIKGNLTNDTKTRRKGSMLQDSLSKIKYLLVFAVLLVLPIWATVSFAQPLLIIDQTDTGVDRLVAFWDTRTRDTFIQVTNTSSEDVHVHVQVFDATSAFTECEECNFPDWYTPNDTHVYDLENMMTNDFSPLMPSEPVCTEIGPGAYGFAVITVLPGSPPNSLIGMFRIIDESGYEYRTNAAGTEDPDHIHTFVEDVNFSDANGHILSDLVGIAYVDLPGVPAVYASPGIEANFGVPQFPIFIVDEDEDPISCSPTHFACEVGHLDRGIDNALPNSKGEANRVCASSILDTNTSGWLFLPFVGFTCFDPLGGGNPDGSCDFNPYFVGFIGLNNGDGTGSMDSWWEPEIEICDNCVEEAGS